MLLDKSLFAFFEKLIPPFSKEDISEPPKGLIGFIAYFSKGLKLFLLVAGILNSLIALGEALFFACLGFLVDWTSSTAPQSFIDEHGYEILVMLIVAGLILPASMVLHSLLIHQTLSSNYSMQVRWQLHNMLLGQSVSFFNEEFAGSLANKVMQASVAVRTTVMKIIDVFIHLAVYIAAMVLMLVNLDFYLCVPLIIWIVFYTLSLVFFIPRLRRMSKAQSVQRSTMVGRIVDSYANIRTVKFFGNTSKERDYAKEAMDDFRVSEYKTLRVLTLFDVSVQFMNCTLLISLVMVSLWLWSNYLITAGAIAVATAIAIRMINLSRWIMWEAGALFENIGMIYDCIETMSKPVTVKDPKAPSVIRNFSDSIEFRNVSFSYNKGKDAIKGISFVIRKGLKLGIVGPSGAGKSTIISLMLRLYDVSGGEILFDGVNIKNYRQDDLRTQFSVVGQDHSLMHRTIRQNIGYGVSGELDEEKLMELAKVTGSLNFIEELSDYRGGSGFNALVGDRGVKLSGGQRQRIALAMVAAKDAPILILDEATSALDSESESLIQDNLQTLMNGKTVIAVSHRLSTLKLMDRIIVVNEGRIIEDGSHEELIAMDGLYKKLWTLQTQGFVK